MKWKISNLKVPKSEVENVKAENAGLKNKFSKIEKIVMPGKIPPSCQEHRDGDTIASRK